MSSRNRSRVLDVSAEKMMRPVFGISDVGILTVIAVAALIGVSGGKWSNALWPRNGSIPCRACLSKK